MSECIVNHLYTAVGTGIAKAFKKCESVLVSAHSIEITCKVKAGLCRITPKNTVEVLTTADKAGKVIKSVLCKLCLGNICRLISSALLLKSNDKSRGCKRVVSAVVKRPICMSCSLNVVTKSDVEKRNSGHCLCNRICSICCLIVKVVCLLEFTARLEDLCVNVISLAALGAGVVCGELCDRSLGILLCLVKSCVAKLVAGHSDKGRNMTSVALKRSSPICIGLYSGISVLVYVNTRDVKVLCGVHVLCNRHIGDGLGHIVLVKLLLGVLSNSLAVCRNNCNGNVLGKICDIEGNTLIGSKSNSFAEANVIAIVNLYLRILVYATRLNEKFACLVVNAKRAIEVSKGRNADLGDGIPELRELLGFVRSEPREVRLVIGVRACHKLCILTVGIGKCIFPRL